MLKPGINTARPVANTINQLNDLAYQVGSVTPAFNDVPGNEFSQSIGGTIQNVSPDMLRLNYPFANYQSPIKLGQVIRSSGFGNVSGPTPFRASDSCLLLVPMKQLYDVSGNFWRFFPEVGSGFNGSGGDYGFVSGKYNDGDWFPLITSGTSSGEVDPLYAPAVNDGDYIYYLHTAKEMYVQLLGSWKYQNRTPIYHGKLKDGSGLDYDDVIRLVICDENGSGDLGEVDVFRNQLRLPEYLPCIEDGGLANRTWAFNFTSGAMSGSHSVWISSDSGSGSGSGYWESGVNGYLLNNIDSSTLSVIVVSGWSGYADHFEAYLSSGGIKWGNGNLPVLVMVEATNNSRWISFSSGDEIRINTFPDGSNSVTISGARAGILTNYYSLSGDISERSGGDTGWVDVTDGEVRHLGGNSGRSNNGSFSISWAGATKTLTTNFQGVRVDKYGHAVGDSLSGTTNIILPVPPDPPDAKIRHLIGHTNQIVDWVGDTNMGSILYWDSNVGDTWAWPTTTKQFAVWDNTAGYYKFCEPDFNWLNIDLSTQQLKHIGPQPLTSPGPVGGISTRDIGNGMWEITISKFDFDATGHYCTLTPNTATAYISGLSGLSGARGKSGFSGFSGWSGKDGKNGGGGARGESGFSGWSGKSGFSGFSGLLPPTEWAWVSGILVWLSGLLTGINGTTTSCT